MKRTENGVNFTLFRTNHNKDNEMYSIQLNTEFTEGNLEARGYKVESIPTKEGDTLKIQLFVSSGSRSHIVHDFEIGKFPKDMKEWFLDVEYANAETGISLPGEEKKVKVTQAEGESEPRPVIEGILG